MIPELQCQLQKVECFTINMKNMIIFHLRLNIAQKSAGTFSKGRLKLVKTEFKLK